ncbi:hypothetical protein ACIPYU_13585 [Paenarthrobacter nicotinovorans]|uniref:hypothetical protein n=1 Tax=Paenarthrobacter nicotinovorans TaxID=29320 RepID=UPI0037FD351F
MPPPYTVNPASARPGEAVTISAPGAKCDPRYGPDAQVLIVITDAAGVEVLKATAPMTDTGAFTFTVDIPAQIAPGVLAVNASPDGVDWCDDTGRNNRVALGAAELARASCAVRTEPLTITK